MCTKANNLLLFQLLPLVDQVAQHLKAIMSVPALYTTHAIIYLKPDLWKLYRTKSLLTSLSTDSSTKVRIYSRHINGSFQCRALAPTYAIVVKAVQLSRIKSIETVKKVSIMVISYEFR